jgi:protein tyrosine/serine phosphatase
MTLWSVFFPSIAAESSEPARKAGWATAVDTSLNLFEVKPGFYRSARLDEKDLAVLQAQGIKTVISLRSFHSDTRLLKDTGITAIRIPINTWAVDDAHIIAALRAIRQAEKEGPFLLHCLHGADRTGLVTAMYRVIYQGWSKAQAMEELTQGGYGYHTLWKNIPKYMERVDPEKIRSAVEL